MKTLTAGILICVALAGQATRDFLTSDEVDQVRLTQEPNARLKLYTEFARLRIELLKQMAAQEKAGRSALIHATLEDYTKIIEAIDTVADDALRRSLEVNEGIEAVAKAEEEMLAALNQIQESNPKDLARYRFALITAIETTEDSLELARQDLAERKREVQERLADDKKRREGLMAPMDVESRRAEEKKRAEAEATQKRKAPTLRRKGETAPKRP